MTDNFTCIYKILQSLETALDYPEYKIEQLTAKQLKVSEERRERYIKLLTEEGYIKNGKITLKGLEYLTFNPIMKHTKERRQCVAKNKM